MTDNEVQTYPDTDVKDSTAPQRTRETQLVAACLRGSVHVAKKLVEKGQASFECRVDMTVGDTYYKDMTPLWAACYSGNVDLVGYLTQQGANVSLETHNGSSPLQCACFSGHLTVARYLLGRGADVNSPYKYGGASALILTCPSGRVDIVNVLLDHGADVNATDKHGSTSLALACSYGHVNVVQALLERGADVNIPNSSGRTALMLACQKEHLDIVNALLDYGAEVNFVVPDEDGTLGGRTALHDNAGSGNVAILKVLLTHGATFCRDRPGETPLLTAACGGHGDYVDWLISLPDISRSDKADALEVLGARHWLDKPRRSTTATKDVPTKAPSLPQVQNAKATPSVLPKGAAQPFNADKALKIASGLSFSQNKKLKNKIKVEDQYDSEEFVEDEDEDEDGPTNLKIAAGFDFNDDNEVCLRRWQQAMEERHRAGRPTVFKKTATKLTVYEYATEVQTLTDLQRLRRSRDRHVLGTEAMLIAERVLGKEGRITAKLIRKNARVHANNGHYDRAMELVLRSLDNLSAVSPFKDNSIITSSALAVVLQVRSGEALRFSDSLAFLRRVVSTVTSAEVVQPGRDQESLLTQRQHLLRAVLHAVCLLQRSLRRASPAEETDYLQEVKDLLGKNFRGQRGDTLLHMACDTETGVFHTEMDLYIGCTFPSSEVVQALTEAGCQANMKNEAGKTALEVLWEQKGDHSQIIHLLSAA